jgi:hypothetical protein
MGRQLSLATRRELIEAVRGRYREAGRDEKRRILDEFVKVSGYHRKHAIRLLTAKVSGEEKETVAGGRRYGERYYRL